MKTLKTNIIMIVITALLFACGSDDNNNPETGEETEIRPISELAEDPDFIKFMELYYFDETEIPDLQAAKELRKKYNEQGVWNNMALNQFEKLAEVYGYNSATALSIKLNELHDVQNLLENRYVLSQADSLKFNTIRMAVYDDLVRQKMKILVKNSIKEARLNKNAWAAFDECEALDTNEFLEDNNARTCAKRLEEAQRRLVIEYGYEFDDPGVEVCYTYTTVEPPVMCLRIEYFDYQDDIEDTGKDYDCCIVKRCDLGESYPELEDELCGPDTVS